MKVIQASRLAFVIFLACTLAGLGLISGQPALAMSAMPAVPGAAAPLAASALGIQIVKATVQGPNGAGSNLPAGNPTGWATATVTCPAGTVLMGGGAQVSPGNMNVTTMSEQPSPLHIEGSFPSDGSGRPVTSAPAQSWTAIAEEGGDVNSPGLMDTTTSAFAVCGTGGPSSNSIVATTVQGPNGAGSNLPAGNPTGWATAVASCPAGKVLLGGGAEVIPGDLHVTTMAEQPSPLHLEGSFPSDASGNPIGSGATASWAGVAEEGADVNSPGQMDTTTSAFAVCGTGGPTSNSVVEATKQGPNGAGSNLPAGNPTGWTTAVATCPAGTGLLSGGGTVSPGNMHVTTMAEQPSPLHLEGSFPSDASGNPIGSGATASWAGVGEEGADTNSPGQMDTTTNAFALCASTAAPTGLLRVTTNPAVPSRISVTPAGSTTPIPMDQWGLNWVKLAPGSYSVSFSDVPGFETPAPQAISITAGNTTVVAGNFTTDGFLRVQLSPAGTDGTISVDGTPRDDYGMWQYLTPGSHQVCFGAVAGFTAPACQNVTVTGGNTTNVTGVYTPSSGTGPGNVGFLRVTTNPAVNARISLVSSGSTTPIPMDQWGLNWVKLAPGSYTVRFSDVPGYETPASQAVTITNGVTTVVAGNYTSDGFLRVQLSPAGTVGTISVNGTPRDDYGMWDFLPPATYQVCFGPAPGFVTTPPCQNATVSGGGAQTNVTGVYS